MSTFLVTGATGNQGGATVDALLAAEQNVRAYTRDPSSPAAQELAARGVTLFKGDFSDRAALDAAMRDCDGVFLNPSPSFTSATAEREEGLNAIAAAKAAGVKHLVYTSSTSAGMPEIGEHVREGSVIAWAFRNKPALEEAVRSAGFQHWTILRPATFFTNFLRPLTDFMYPHLLKEGVLKTNYAEDTKIFLIDPLDIGKFAGAAFLEPQRFNAKIIPLASEWKNIQGIAHEMTKAGEKKVRTEAYSEEEAAGNLMAEVQNLLNKIEFFSDVEYAKSWGIQMRSFSDFLKANRDVLARSVGP